VTTSTTARPIALWLTTGAFAYLSSVDTISVLDLTDPRDPVLRGTLVNALFENESMTYGERVIDGTLTRFVIAAIDLPAQLHAPQRRGLEARHPAVDRQRQRVAGD